MYGDEKKILTLDSTKPKDSKGSFSLYLSTALPAVFAFIPTVIPIIFIPFAIKKGGAEAGISLGLLAALFGGVFIYALVNTIDMIKMMREARNWEYDIIESKVSMVSERLEDKVYGHHGYHTLVTRYYMTFKDYGEAECSFGVREGDKYYLLIEKNSNRLIEAYSAAEYVYKPSKKNTN